MPQEQNSRKKKLESAHKYRRTLNSREQTLLCMELHALLHCEVPGSIMGVAPESDLRKNTENLIIVA